MMTPDLAGDTTLGAERLGEWESRGAAREMDLRRRINIELNFPPNFEGLVLGCIDANKQAARSSSPSRRKRKEKRPRYARATKCP